MPTFLGYSAQGFGKFGFYEIFKDVYRKALGDKAAKYQTVGFMFASACAEVIADCLLCPMEAIKVKQQTDNTGTFPRGFGAGINYLKETEGQAGFYKGLQPLWMRQVPYTMVKFVAFEKTVKFIYAKWFPGERSQYSKAT